MQKPRCLQCTANANLTRQSFIKLIYFLLTSQYASLEHKKGTLKRDSENMNIHRESSKTRRHVRIRCCLNTEKLQRQICSPQQLQYDYLWLFVCSQGAVHVRYNMHMNEFKLPPSSSKSRSISVRVNTLHCLGLFKQVEIHVLIKNFRKFKPNNRLLHRDAVWIWQEWCSEWRYK